MKIDTARFSPEQFLSDVVESLAETEEFPTLNAENVYKVFELFS